MGSSKIKAQGQSQGHLPRHSCNKNITWQYQVLELVYRCVYMSICI